MGRGGKFAMVGKIGVEIGTDYTVCKSGRIGGEESREMERREYLELCRRYAMGDGRVKVAYRGGEYNPIGYRLWYDREGKAKHTAIIRECVAKNSVSYVLLEKVEKSEEGVVGSK